MEEAYELENYLPLSFKTKSEQDYITFLWEAYAVNHASGKYQFAFLAYHMLTMAAVYFNIWQIRHHLPSEFKASMVGFSLDHEKELLGSNSPFAFHCVNESAVMRFMKLLGIPNDKIGAYTKLVKDRNSIAHCNAIVFPADEASLDAKIGEVLRVMQDKDHHPVATTTATPAAASDRNPQPTPRLQRPFAIVPSPRHASDSPAQRVYMRVRVRSITPSGRSHPVSKRELRPPEHPVQDGSRRGWQPSTRSFATPVVPDP